MAVQALVHRQRMLGAVRVVRVVLSWSPLGTGSAAGITVNARGGAGAGGVFGGSIETDGPGGGGGGGQFLSNGGGSASLTGGAPGTISNGANVTCSTGSSCGATAGVAVPIHSYFIPHRQYGCLCGPLRMSAQYYGYQDHQHAGV